MISRWSTPAGVALAVFVLLAAGFLIWLLRPVLLPFAVAAVLAYLGDPLIDRMMQWRLTRWLGRGGAVALGFILFSVAVAALLIVVVPLIENEIAAFVNRVPDYLAWLTAVALPWIEGKIGLELSLPDLKTLPLIVQQYWREVGGLAAFLLSSLSRGGAALAMWIANLLLIPVVTFYLLRDFDPILAHLERLLPRSMAPGARRLGREIDEVLAAFIRGQLLVMLVLGMVYSFGLWVAGIDFALLIGSAAGLLSIVPYLGTIVGFALAVVTALVQYHDLLHPLLAVAVFVAGQSLEGMLLTPWLVGDRIGLHPVAVIFAVLAGGQLFGFFGILLALPVAAAVMVLVRDFLCRYQASEWYGGVKHADRRGPRRRKRRVRQQAAAKTLPDD